jgi:signal transduction histidine kinase
MAVKHPQYYKVHTVLKAEIAFYLNDRQLYEEAHRQFLQVNKEHPLLDVYGKDMMAMVKATFDGNYSKALDILEHDSPDFDALDRCDMRIRICELMGNKERAIKEVDYRRDLRDSLNSDMMFESINEINGEMGLQRMKEEALEKEKKATKRQNLLLSIALIMVVAALGLVISRNLMRRHYQKKLMKQNKELEVALSRAEESDRMKDSFIKHVSHEIRTPLNIITGYTQIINNPEYDLTEEERSRMLSDISKNTQMISYIVNELLEVAEDESKQHYSKDDIIAVNEFCRRLIGQAEIKNKGRLSLEFISELDEDFTVHSNRRAIEKVLDQLLDNAMKFTDTGYVELKVHDSPDHGVVRFIVQDSGIGISEENHNRIFDRFFKEDVFKQGFGLGLTMSLKMAILLGGSLSLDKDYKAGARFILTIPVKS